MFRKKIIAGLGIVILSAVSYLFYSGDRQANTDYIFDQSKPIPLAASLKSRKPLRSKQILPVNISEGNTKGISGEVIPIEDFLSGVPDEDTLRYFHHLHRLYRKSPDIEVHFTEIEAYLLSNLPKAEADKIFALYKQYLQCEIDLIKESESQVPAIDPESIIAQMKKNHEFRREQLGIEIADALFGAEVKNREYAIRRAVVVNEKELYGEEKERMLDGLNQDMWGDEADLVNKVPKPYNRYREKIAIYQKDFAEISSEEELALIKKFRKELLPEDAVERFEEIDKKVAEEKETKLSYRVAEENILQNKDLTHQEQESQIKILQNESFGGQADAFRRSEAMRIGLEKLKTETEKNRG